MACLPGWARPPLSGTGESYHREPSKRPARLPGASYVPGAPAVYVVELPEVVDSVPPALFRIAQVMPLFVVLITSPVIVTPCPGMRLADVCVRITVIAALTTIGIVTDFVVSTVLVAVT